MSLPDPLTLRKLAERSGVVLPDPLPRQWPLEQWFAEVSDLPLEQLTAFGLARACRQKIELDAIFPFCLTALEADVLAGELYEGELLSAVLDLPPDFWTARPQQLDAFIAVCDAAVLETEDATLIAEIDHWLSRQDVRDS